MALLARQDASGLSGAAITFTTANASDTVAGGQGVHLLVDNGSAAAVAVTLVTPETVEGALEVDDREITVAIGAFREIPVPSRYNDPTTGLATVQFSPTDAALMVAAVRGSATP